MKGMQNAAEIFQAPTPGTYPVVIVAAEAGVSQAGNSQIVVSLEIQDGKFKGEQMLDWVGTDPSAKGAGIGRGKLRILLQGTPYNGLADAADSNEVPDAQIAQALVGQRLFAVIDNSPRKKKDDNGKRTNENMTQLDPGSGLLVTVMNADVKGYTRHVATQQPAAQQLQSLPAQGFAQGGQTAQTFAPAQGQQSFTQAPAQAQGNLAPTGLPFQPNYTPGAAVPPWAAAANGAQGNEQPAPKKTRKLIAQDVPGT